MKTALKKQMFAEAVFFACVAFVVLLATYLFATYSRFQQGHTIGFEFAHGEPNRFSSTTPDYVFISQHYFAVMIAMLVVAVVCWIRSNIVIGSFNLSLISYSIYHAGEIYQTKSDIYSFENYDARYFDVVRETILFDGVGAVLLAGSLMLQLYLLWLYLRGRQLQEKGK